MQRYFSKLFSNRISFFWDVMKSDMIDRINFLNVLLLLHWNNMEIFAKWVKPISYPGQLKICTILLNSGWQNQDLFPESLKYYFYLDIFPPLFLHNTFFWLIIICTKTLFNNFTCILWENMTPFPIPFPSNKQEVSRDNSHVTLSLSKLKPEATGTYRCEVLGEHPTFRTESLHAFMKVLREYPLSKK